MFTEADFEIMVYQTIAKNGWKYIPAEQLPRQHSDVMVESMVKDALIRLNPVIAEDPSRADEVIYKLRTLILSAQANNLIAANEEFKKLVFENNSFPFGENGRSVSIDFFGSLTPERLALNEYVVTNQWVYPKAEGGKRLDIVLLINGFPIAIGELKTPVREAISWMDGAGDILAYEKSIPQMFVTNVFNFASEGKCFRYSSVNAPLTVWGPWHTEEHKSEGTMAQVQESITDMMKPEIIMDIFRFFTLFATDKKHRKYKIICRYQQFEGANAIVQRVLEGKNKQGLIWHFQGSGKSLLMVFAAQKLRMMPELKAPTVVIVDDRIDLETQITATFNASDIDHQHIEVKTIKKPQIKKNEYSQYVNNKKTKINPKSKIKKTSKVFNAIKIVLVVILFISLLLGVGISVLVREYTDTDEYYTQYEDLTFQDVIDNGYDEYDTVITGIDYRDTIISYLEDNHYEETTSYEYVNKYSEDSDLYATLNIESMKNNIQYYITVNFCGGIKTGTTLTLSGQLKEDINREKFYIKQEYVDDLAQELEIYNAYNILKNSHDKMTKEEDKENSYKYSHYDDMSIYLVE